MNNNTNTHKYNNRRKRRARKRNIDKYVNKVHKNTQKQLRANVRVKLHDEVPPVQVEAVYLDVLENLNYKADKKMKEKIMATVKILLESGLTNEAIVSMFRVDPSVGIPVVARSPDAWAQALKWTAAGIVHIAIQKNLPVCQDIFEFNNTSYSVLLAAYWVSLLDTYRYMQDRIRVVTYDHKTCQDLKQALVQKMAAGSTNFAYTWNNVDRDLLTFLGESAYPEDIDIYTAGLFDGVVGGFPEIRTTPTNGITDEVVEKEFVEHYIKVITQIAGENEDLLTEVDDYHSIFADSTEPWALIVPTSIDPENHMSVFGDVRHDMDIPPSRQWLSLLPFVQPSEIFNSTIKVRFTGHFGVSQYYRRIQEGIYGYDPVIVSPVFHYWNQVTDMWVKEAILADMDIAEIKATSNIDQPNDSILSNITQQDIVVWLFNIVNTIYHPSNCLFAYSLPGNFKTMAGMEAIPNVNYSGNQIFTSIAEQLEKIGIVRGYKRRTRTMARVDYYPVFVFKEGVIGAQDTDLSSYGDMFPRSNLNWSLLNIAQTVTTIPQPMASKLCYTRGNTPQELWYQFPTAIAQFANVNCISRFEDFSTVNDYDKVTFTFTNANMVGTKQYNRHFLGYQSARVTIGEKNCLRLSMGQVINLGVESLSFEEKLERVRTCQTFKGLKASEYVDSLQDPMFEGPNNIYDITTQTVQMGRHFRYQNHVTDEQVKYYTVLMRGEGGNMWATLRDKVGGVIKKVAPIAGPVVGALTGSPELGMIVGAAGSLFDKKEEDERKVGHPSEAYVEIPTVKGKVSIEEKETK